MFKTSMICLMVSCCVPTAAPASAQDAVGVGPGGIPNGLGPNGSETFSPGPSTQSSVGASGYVGGQPTMRATGSPRVRRTPARGQRFSPKP